MSSAIGKKLQLILYGESHGNAIGAVACGLPAGFAIDIPRLNAFLQRRKTGQNKFTTPRKELDEFEFLSGFYDGKLTGTPLSVMIKNKDLRSKDYSELKEKMRPSHADYTGYLKYNSHNDIRGGGHFSGRITAPLCVIGGISLQILDSMGIQIYGHISSLHDIEDTPIESVSTDMQKSVSKKDLAFFDDTKLEQAKDLLSQIINQKDSVGGTIEIMVHNIIKGLGEPIFDAVESRLAQMIFSIPAVKGLEFGNGFYSTKLKGSDNNDPFEIKDNDVITTTNNSGGINGGITNGMPIILKVAIKPTPSIGIPQNTINIKTKQNTTLQIVGRHDPAIVLRAVPVIESAVAITLLDIILEEKNGTIRY